jgi:hypothetical protein
MTVDVYTTYNAIPKVSTMTSSRRKYRSQSTCGFKDRVKQGQFQIFQIPGLQKAADLLTKSLPVARHRFLAPFPPLDPEDSVDSLYKTQLCYD